MAVVRTSKVDLKVNGDGAYAYVAEPDDNEKHPGMVLIQEWWGIESHVMDLAQKLAADGFVVAVPDLYHGKVATEPNDAQKMVMTMTSSSAALVITPGVPALIVAAGRPKFVVFVKLKNSERNCRRFCSAN